MIRRTLYILIAGIVVGTVRFSGSAEGGETFSNPCLNEFTEGHFSLAECVVVHVGKPKRKRVRATLEVREVFVGEVKVGTRLEASFSFYTYFPFGSLLGPGPEFLYPPPDIGEKQLWAVRRRKDGTFVSSCRELFGTSWPVRSGGNQTVWGPEGTNPYEHYRKVAEMIRALSRAAPSGQPSILRRGAESDIRLVSHAAVVCLERWRCPACRKALATLRDKIFRLPIPNQTYLDEALCKVFAEDWIGSNERRRLLESWITPRILNEIGLDQTNAGDFWSPGSPPGFSMTTRKTRRWSSDCWVHLTRGNWILTNFSTSQSGLRKTRK